MSGAIEVEGRIPNPFTVYLGSIDDTDGVKNVTLLIFVQVPVCNKISKPLVHLNLGAR